MGLPEPTGEERVFELPESVEADLARYKEITQAMTAMAKAGTALKEEADQLKARLVEALAVDADPDTEEKVLGTRHGHPVLRATVFPSTSFQAKEFKQHHPEVYRKYLKTYQSVRVTLA